MKLTEITLENVLQSNHHCIGRLSDGVSIIEGQPGTGKTAIRDFVRDVLFGNGRYLGSNARPVHYAPPRGELTIQNSSGEYRFQRNWNTGELQVVTLNGQPFSGTHSYQTLLGNLNAEIFDTVFSFSLKQTQNGLARLARVLNLHLGVPNGASTCQKHSCTSDAGSRRSRLVALQQRIDLLKQNRQNIICGHEQQDVLRQARLLEIEKEMEGVLQQINELELTTKRGHLTNLEREIAELRLFIEGIVRRESVISSPAQRPNLPDPYQLLYLRLDEIDSQIRRWRRIQADVQAQRVRLKDEMIVWGEMTLDSADHPYHVARKLLVSLEERINETDKQARQWELAPVHQTDPSQTVRTIQTHCQSMRHDLHSLSQELGLQFKNIRHRAAAVELKQLRHFYNVMNENIDRLVQRREQVINEIRFLDLAGAEAIVRAEAAFMQCAMHEGYLEARRRFVGSISVLAEPTISPSRIDLAESRSRLQNLQAELNQLQRWIVEGEANLVRLRTSKSQLDAERTSLLTAERQLATGHLAQIDAELHRVTNEHDALVRLLDEEQNYEKPISNQILTHATTFLQQLSNRELQRVWLSESANGVIEVLDQHGQVRNAASLSNTFQDMVYLSLAFAAKYALVGQGVVFPTLVDDVSIHFNHEQLESVMRSFNGLQQDGHQVLALMQHTYFGLETTNFARFTLPAKSEVTSVPLMPPLEGFPHHGAPIAVMPGNSKSTPSDVLHHWIDSGDIDPVTLQRSDVSYSRPLDLYYPMSKYSAPEKADYQELADYIVRYPAPKSPDAETRSSSPYSTTKSSQRVTPVSVDTLGDHLGFAPAIDDLTELDRIDLFDLNRLRSLSELGIESVGQLLELRPEDMPSGLREHGITSDQLNRWQAIIWLLSNIPGLRIEDAKILVACGVTEPEHLATSHPQQLLERIHRFLNSGEGQRFAQQAPSINLLRVNGWLRALNISRPRWQNGNGLSRYTRHRSLSGNSVLSNSIGIAGQNEPARSRSTARPTMEHGTGQPVPFARSADGQHESQMRPIRADLLPQRDQREPFITRQPRMRTPEPIEVRPPTEFSQAKARPIERDRAQPTDGNQKQFSRHSSSPEPAQIASRTFAEPVKRQRADRIEQNNLNESKLRFYLDLKDHVEAAPSIGPKTAERFERIGVRTVEDFLKQTAESMASKLTYKRITPDLVRAWQHQTRLVCRIPNLRGHDAQLLVACNLIEPEKIAAMHPQRLLDIVLPFARSKEGLKIVRTGKEPDLLEVSDWIKWAAMTRSLHAA